MTLSSYDAFNEWYRKYFSETTDPAHRMNMYAAWSAATERLAGVVNAAEKCVSNRAWAGVCDEDVELETAVKALRGE
jgi:uncharacterized protein involved in tolerance to divalent cations